MSRLAFRNENYRTRSSHKLCVKPLRALRAMPVGASETVEGTRLAPKILT